MRPAYKLSLGRFKETERAAKKISLSRQAIRLSPKKENSQLSKQWAERDSNSHDRSRHILSVVRLPISPSARSKAIIITLSTAI